MPQTLRLSALPSQAQGGADSTAPASWHWSCSSSRPVSGHGVSRDTMSGRRAGARPAGWAAGGRLGDGSGSAASEPSLATACSMPSPTSVPTVDSTSRSASSHCCRAACRRSRPSAVSTTGMRRLSSLVVVRRMRPLSSRRYNRLLSPAGDTDSRASSTLGVTGVASVPIALSTSNSPRVRSKPVQIVCIRDSSSWVSSRTWAVKASGGAAPATVMDILAPHFPLIVDPGRAVPRSVSGTSHVLGVS